MEPQQSTYVFEIPHKNPIKDQFSYFLIYLEYRDALQRRKHGDGHYNHLRSRTTFRHTIVGILSDGCEPEMVVCPVTYPYKAQVSDYARY
jgi:hypothetical protein